MADEDSQPEGIEALLQTLDPERQKILLFLLEQDHLAALGAELVGPRAFSPEESDTARPPTKLGWTSSGWGDERLPGTISKPTVLNLASESLEGLRFPPSDFGKDRREEAEKLLYTKDGILQPFVFFNRSRPASPALPAGDFGPKGEPKAAITVLDEMQTLVHELRHVGDMWQTRNADMDAEFSGKAGYDDTETLDLDLQRKGWEDYAYYDQPRRLTLAERYKSDPVYSDEPYARLMDRYNQERLRDEGYQLDSSAYKTEVQKLGYIPDRYQMSLRPRSGWKHDPFATGYSTWSFPSEVESREAAGHPAQGGALTELNRRKGRDPLEGMDQWLQRHGR